MKCPACGKIFQDDEAKCPACGFPVIQIIGDADSAAAENAADEWRKKLVGKYSLEVKIYGYEKKNGQQVLKEERDYTIAKCGDMKPGVPVWADKEFAYPEGEETLQIPLTINRGGEKASVAVTLRNIPGAKICQLGAVMDDNLHVRILVYADDMIVQSKKIALFPEK